MSFILVEIKFQILKLYCSDIYHPCIIEIHVCCMMYVCCNQSGDPESSLSEML